MLKGLSTNTSDWKLQNLCWTLVTSEANVLLISSVKYCYVPRTWQVTGISQSEGSCISDLAVSSLYPVATDLDQRSRTSSTALCNGIVSHGALLGGIWIFANHTCGNKRNQNVFTNECLSACSDRCRCGWYMHQTNHNYFDCRKTLNTPNWDWAPYQEENGKDSWISGLNLCLWVRKSQIKPWLPCITIQNILPFWQ